MKKIRAKYTISLNFCIQFSLTGILNYPVLRSRGLSSFLSSTAVATRIR